ncbi:ATP-dependent DNA helicase PIF1-like isoform X2 [Dendronephthya gigantea]|uniref:ATP-dependent DNA helicase PIF1-like isoform X2 n=1 Tax=Dendronephthya gigantea TaxID=151771 RepID=UPI001069EDAC|nr:ATP-dependent DNA helicase PIF1-like isoform X2 [Dendronephthya gigantea]
MDASELHCTTNVEKLNEQGIVLRRTVYKSCSTILGRDQFDDILLRIVSKQQIAQSFLLKKISIHRRFVREGKATIKLLTQNVLVMLSNCPPDKLAAFLACLKVKLAVKSNEGFTGDRKRLRSELPRSFEHISPLVENDLLRAKENIAPATLHDKTPKRKRCEGSSDNLPRKKLMITSNNAVKPARSSVKLNKSQLRVLNAVKCGQSVFITGSGGTGKSFLLRKIIGLLPPHNTFVTASTGVAACQIGGMTLHSFSGIGCGKGNLENCIAMASNRIHLQQWKNCKHLIIDEISMIDSELFDKIEAVARALRKNDRPFGGIQLIVCGDFLQLPPVIKPGEKKKFCFQAESWSTCIHKTIELIEVKRQSDPLFINILNNIRVGRCPDEVVERLSRSKENKIDSEGILATRLCTHKENVDQINKVQLQSLPGKAKSFQAVDSDNNFSKTLDSCCPAKAKLELKEGAQVLLTKNLDVGQGLVNGARGVVKSFSTGNTDEYKS